jgi:tRNA G18 (ribose-2'-O)-methylase SpoU
MKTSFINNLGQIQDTDNRNIQERYRWWDHEDIVGDLEATRSEVVSVFLNIDGDFNISSGIRSNLWFNTHGTWIAGKKRYDRRGAVGSHLYTPVDHNPTPLDLLNDLRNDGYTLVAAEITDDAVPLTTYQWDSKSAIIFGEEGAGLAQEILDAVDQVVYIPGRGSLRSLNVATTAGIFLYDYSMKTGNI